MKKQGLLIGFMSVLAACAQGVAPGGGESASSVAAPVRTLLVADRAMSADQVSFQKTNLGGLIANLFVQPRSTMAAPDTQTVGCNQAGQGALGIDAYLNQPTWATRSVILQGLFVPTRNFALGFPVADAALPVKSFFVIDGGGFFKLADGEPEGDFQFAVIADDGARLLIGNGEGFSPAVDDEKPAGDNKGCLERTQSAHMSCTTQWTDQSAAKVRVVHLAPGDHLPIRFQYWQGPGFGLSMMAFYRRVKPGALIDPSCGLERGYGAGSKALADVMSSWTPIGEQNLTNSTAN